MATLGTAAKAETIRKFPKKADSMIIAENDFLKQQKSILYSKDIRLRYQLEISVCCSGYRSGTGRSAGG